MSTPIGTPPANIPFVDNNNLIRPEWYIFIQQLYLRGGGAVSQNNNELIAGQLDDAGIEESKAEIYTLRDQISSALIGVQNSIDDLGMAPVPQPGYDYNPAAVAITGGAVSGVSGAFSTLSASGDVTLSKTMTPFGTTGAQTINNSMGRVNFAAGAGSLVVTNSLCSVTSIIMCSVGTVDATMKSVSVAANAGSFTITANAVATAETRVNFLLLN
jgi:hypothetical protein